jgi:hypothetical protein
MIEEEFCGIAKERSETLLVSTIEIHPTKEHIPSRGGNEVLS